MFHGGEKRETKPDPALTLLPVITFNRARVLLWWFDWWRLNVCYYSGNITAVCPVVGQKTLEIASDGVLGVQVGS